LNSNTPKEEKTELLYGVEAAVERGVRFMKNVKLRMDLFGEKNGPSIIMEFEVYKNNYIDVIGRGGKIRFITEITKENLPYCKELRKIVTEMRHMEGLVGGIAVSESEYMSTSSLREKELLTQVFHSNADEIVRQGQYIFDAFWNNAIPAEERIKEIEEGIKPDFIETIRESTRVQDIAFELVKSCKEEILIIFSTANAFFRQERSGGIALLDQAATRRNIGVRILVPYDQRLEQFITSLDTNDNKTKYKDRKCKINIRFLEQNLQTKITVLIADRKSSLVVELKDDRENTVNRAIGLSSYSNSQSTVLSYVSIFEALWKQTEMYQQLKVQDRMQQDFINIAAHELRTPIQPILGLSEVALSKIVKTGDTELIQLLNIIYRNAKRLQQLTEDILDVTKIESHQPLILNKQPVNLEELIAKTINDIARNRELFNSNYRDIKLLKTVHPSVSTDTVVLADKRRITQVIYNLISNAIKFTDEEDTISISINTTTGDQKEKFVLITVKDTGEGINPDIMPRLFTKFASKSYAGTGLGLFICKSIIEAHKGRIWAENNADGRGATFCFSLPIGK
jgi:two-component system sensor histidine kinase VicK